ncbi:MAG TPA: DUF1015 domain-containing protein, partial [Bacteroidota bacterium]|nr:DUF1015 domain-containing protein [Bacteroidota bacterium]
MADIRPFRGILYNTEKVGIADVVAPPYDVISPQQQQELYERSPYNVVRVILGREQDPYTSAATCLVHWLKEGILQQDARAAMYFVSQEFGIADRTRVVRQGIIAACRLEEFGKGSVFPHERTLSGPKEDRFKLFQSTQTMFSQILSLYGDRDHI